MVSIDPFDPKSLRLTQEFTGDIGVKKVVTTIAVRRPDKQRFIRVHPSADMQIETAVLELKDEGETYLVLHDVLREAPNEFVPKVLRVAIDRQDNVFLWPIRLPDAAGRLDDWSRSAMTAAKHAERHWIRLMANRAVGAYEIFEATGAISEPSWPDMSLKEILRLAFRDRFIDRTDHPVLLRLRGAT